MGRIKKNWVKKITTTRLEIKIAKRFTFLHISYYNAAQNYLVLSIPHGQK
jgi:hypothetical protein